MFNTIEFVDLRFVILLCALKLLCLLMYYLPVGNAHRVHKAVIQGT